MFASSKPVSGSDYFACREVLDAFHARGFDQPPLQIVPVSTRGRLQHEISVKKYRGGTRHARPLMVRAHKSVGLQGDLQRDCGANIRGTVPGPPPRIRGMRDGDTRC